MEIYKECKAIILPHNNIDTTLTLYKDIGLSLNTDRLQHHINQHLYEVSDDEIKVNDWIISKMLLKDKNVINPIYKYVLLQVGRITNKTIYNVEDNYKIPLGHYCKKVIATTDKSLNLPLIPLLYLEKYVELYNSGIKNDMISVGYIEE